MVGKRKIYKRRIFVKKMNLYKIFYSNGPSRIFYMNNKIHRNYILLAWLDFDTAQKIFHKNGVGKGIKQVNK